MSLALKQTEDKSGKGEATTWKRKDESPKELLDKIDLTGLRDWSQDEEKEAWQLIIEYASIFAMSDMDLGKTSLVKHSIRLCITLHLRRVIGRSYQAWMRKSGNI